MAQAELSSLRAGTGDLVRVARGRGRARPRLGELRAAAFVTVVPRLELLAAAHRGTRLSLTWGSGISPSKVAELYASDVTLRP